MEGDPGPRYDPEAGVCGGAGVVEKRCILGLSGLCLAPAACARCARWDSMELTMTRRPALSMVGRRP